MTDFQRMTDTNSSQEQITGSPAKLWFWGVAACGLGANLVVAFFLQIVDGNIGWQNVSPWAVVFLGAFSGGGRHRARKLPQTRVRLKSKLRDRHDGGGSSSCFSECSFAHIRLFSLIAGTVRWWDLVYFAFLYWLVIAFYRNVSQGRPI